MNLYISKDNCIEMAIINGEIENIQKIIDQMERGPVVIPTETLYAIAIPIRNRAGFDEVYRLKNVRMQTASPIGFYGMRDMEKYCVMDEGAKNIVRKVMPGPLTLILKAKIDGHWVINGKIAARVSSSTLVREIIRKVGPITLVGANVRGFRASTDLKEIMGQFGDKVKLYVRGKEMNGNPSTIYDCTSRKLIREGEIQLREIKEAENGV